MREPFRVVVADPPWHFGDRLPGSGRGASKHYDTMRVEEIERFLCYNTWTITPDAWLFLWRVSSMQEEALRVAQAWGFTLKTELVWLKRTSGGRRWFGMGRYLRAEHETCLVCTKGRVRPAVRNVRSTFEAPAGRHSERPEGFFRIIEQLVPGGPYLELFSRRQRSGWTCVGNELREPVLLARSSQVMDPMEVQRA